jgi:hypothetical protein
MKNYTSNIYPILMMAVVLASCGLSKPITQTIQSEQFPTSTITKQTSTPSPTKTTSTTPTATFTITPDLLSQANVTFNCIDLLPE